MRTSTAALLRSLDSDGLLDGCAVCYSVQHGWIVREPGVRYPLTFSTFEFCKGYLQGRKQNRMKALIYRQA